MQAATKYPPHLQSRQARHYRDCRVKTQPRRTAGHLRALRRQHAQDTQQVHAVAQTPGHQD